jgi:hypothetical protein
MAHDVRIKLNTAVVRHKDLEVIVKRGTGKLGTLLISQGNIEWLPKGNSVNKRRLSWKQFAALMIKKGAKKKGAKVKKR